jgi:hypothetical protein
MMIVLEPIRGDCHPMILQIFTKLYQPAASELANNVSYTISSIRARGRKAVTTPSTQK